MNNLHSTRDAVCHTAPTEAQRRAIYLLHEDCAAFVADGSLRTPTDHLGVLGGTADSYWGEPVYVAHPITLAQVEPTLPKEGVAGSVDICSVLRGQVRDQIRDPGSLILPKAERPAAPQRAKTMLADPAEWAGLADLMWRRDLCLWLPAYKIFHHDEEPGVNGLFGVGKNKDVPGQPGLEQLRLICNLVPSNSYFRAVRGDVDHLPISSSGRLSFC